MQSAVILGFTLGLASALHCVAMCGPLVAFVALAPNGETDPWRVARYQLGRVLGYGALGAAAGALGGNLAGLVPAEAEAILSLTLGVALAVAAFQLWPRAAREQSLAALGRAPRAPTLRERSTRALGALLGRVRRVPMALGALSALLPCGVLASGVLLAASTGRAAEGGAALSGLAISSGLVLALTGASLGRARIASSPALARTMAMTLALGALVLFVRPALVTSDGPACCHAHS